jgi:hypothetical protein
MKLSCERLAIFTLSAMLTTLAFTPTPRHASQHPTSTLVDALSLPGDRCTPSLTEETHAAIRAAIEGTRFYPGP